MRHCAMTSEPIKWHLRDRVVFKVLLLLWHWEWCVFFFLAVCRILIKKVWSGCGEGYFFVLSFLSFPGKTRLNFQKNNCALWFVILSILILLLLINFYLPFNVFLSLDFSNSIPGHFFNLIFFIGFGPFNLNALFYALYFSWLFCFCNFIPFNFIVLF